MLRLVVATSLFVLVAGCTDPEPKEPKPSTSATPTATAPTMPAQAKENSPEGASAFVAHYIDVFNHAANSGDVEQLERLSDPKCSACMEYASEFEKIYERGDRISEHLWTLKSVELDTDGREFRITTRVEVNEGAETTDYRFVFLLPTPPPFKIQSIKILEPA